jgi:hypothetical protein
MSKEINDLREAYAFLFGETDGDTVLHDLEMRFHVHSPTFSADPYETAFREGQRSVVLFIQGMMETFNLPNEVIDDE